MSDIDFTDRKNKYGDLTEETEVLVDGKIYLFHRLDNLNFPNHIHLREPETDTIRIISIAEIESGNITVEVRKIKKEGIDYDEIAAELKKQKY